MRTQSKRAANETVIRAVLAEIDYIAALLQPRAWQPWQVDRAAILLAIDTLTAARAALATVLAPPQPAKE